MDGLTPVTVIIRSAGQPMRAEAFKRAVRSATGQQGVEPSVVVVFNGKACDESLVEWTRAQEKTTVYVLIGGGKREATTLGRKVVDAPYFCFLDDDDELLPGALAVRAAAFREDAGLDCVATNGYRHENGLDDKLFPDTSTFVPGRYIESLVRSRNWLAAGAATFRTATVDLSYFDFLPPHREWTMIAYRIGAKLKIRFMDVPTCRIYSTVRSQSKTDTYVESAVSIWRQILEMNDAPQFERDIKTKLGLSHRNICSYYRLNGQFGRAWAAYWRAVLARGGWRFVPYAGLLLAGSSKPATQIMRRPSSGP